MNKTNFNKSPFVEINDQDCYVGWKKISEKIQKQLDTISKNQKFLVVEIYPGAFEEDISTALQKYLNPTLIINPKNYYKDEEEIREMTERELGDDPIFGVLSYLRIDDYFKSSAKNEFARNLDTEDCDIVMVIGTGASKLIEPDVLVYVDMARWEIQQRQRRNEISNLGVSNPNDRPSLKYKWAFFIDWRVCDRLKRQLFGRWDFVIDTNDHTTAKMIFF
jgi:hypothetical protein